MRTSEPKPFVANEPRESDKEGRQGKELTDKALNIPNASMAQTVRYIAPKAIDIGASLGICSAKV